MRQKAAPGSPYGCPSAGGETDLSTAPVTRFTNPLASIGSNCHHGRGDFVGNRPNVLEEILVGVRADVATRQQSRSLADVKARAASAPSPLDGLAVLRAPGVGVVAELKRRSPSRGQLANIDDPAGLAQEYEAGGARVISVLDRAAPFRRITRRPRPGTNGGGDSAAA